MDKGWRAIAAGLVRPCGLGYMARMSRTPVVLIADRSYLAANIYRLLLAPLGVTILIRPRCSDALAHVKAGAGVDLLVVNTNSMGNAAGDLIEALSSDRRAAKIRKMIISGDSKAEERICARLRKAPRTTFVERPFLPGDLLKAVERRLAEAAR